MRFQVVTVLDEHWDQLNDDVDTWGNFTANDFQRHKGFSIVFASPCKINVNVKSTDSIGPIMRVNVKFDQSANHNNKFRAIFSIVPYVQSQDNESVISENGSDEEFIVDDDEIEEEEEDDESDLEDTDDSIEDIDEL
jgi:hypothetical protein